MSRTEAQISNAQDSAAVSRQDYENVDPCWVQIGVYGQRNCPELEKFIHCRNCPVYSEAGIRLLDRPLSADYRLEWSTHFANDEKRTSRAKTSAVVFRIASEWLALPTQAFQEIAEHRRVHSLPHRRNGIVLGLVNVRGELVICVALDRLIGIDSRITKAENESVAARRRRFLVVGWEDSRLVFPVDQIDGIHRFQSKELKEPPATVTKSNLSYTRGLLLWNQKTIGLLEAESLFRALNEKLS